MRAAGAVAVKEHILCSSSCNLPSDLNPPSLSTDPIRAMGQWEVKTPQRPHSTITSPSRWTRRIDGRTYWGEGKEKHGGFELKRWCAALSLSIFSASLSLSQPQLHVFRREMARSLAAVRGRPLPPHRPTVGRLCILQTTRRCTAPARERETQPCRKKDGRRWRTRTRCCSVTESSPMHSRRAPAPGHQCPRPSC